MSILPRACLAKYVTAILKSRTTRWDFMYIMFSKQTNFRNADILVLRKYDISKVNNVYGALKTTAWNQAPVWQVELELYRKGVRSLCRWYQFWVFTERSFRCSGYKFWMELRRMREGKLPTPPFWWNYSLSKLGFWGVDLGGFKIIHVIIASNFMDITVFGLS